MSSDPAKQPSKPDPNSNTDDLAENLSKLTIKEPPTVLGHDLTLKGVAEAIKTGKVKKIVVLSGAGISVAAGIPDFRTPGTGLYDNLQKYNLPRATAVFELKYFREKPTAFYELAREMFPGKYKPTPAHYFVRLLQDKDILLRNFTQNIDTLEKVAGIKEEKLVEAHGSFGSASCIDCKEPFHYETIKKMIFSDKKPIPRCENCNGLVKPNIVFFGENLPDLFTERASDLHECDLLIVMGTSLKVYPFADLVEFPPKRTPRLLMNRELAGDFTLENPKLRDIIVLDDVQTSIHQLVDLLGWKKEFEDLLNSVPPLVLDLEKESNQSSFFETLSLGSCEAL